MQDVKMTEETTGPENEDQIMCIHLCNFSPTIWSVILQVLHFPCPAFSVSPTDSVKALEATSVPGYLS